MGEEAVALDPGDDPALRSFHDEGVRSLEIFGLVRRVIATQNWLMCAATQCLFAAAPEQCNDPVRRPGQQDYPGPENERRPASPTSSCPHPRRPGCCPAVSSPPGTLRQRLPAGAQERPGTPR